MLTSQPPDRKRRIVPGTVSCLLAVFLLLAASGPASAQGQGEYGTEFNGGIMVPAGKYAKYFKPGFILQGGAFTGLSKAVRFGFGIGYMRSNVDGEKYSEDISSNYSGDYTVDGSLKGLPILLTLRLVTPGEGMRFYGLLDAGVYCYWVKLEGTATGTSSPAPLPFEEQFFAEPGVALGFGGLLPVGKNVALDLSVRYNIVKDANYAETYDDNEFAMNTSSFLGFQIGVNYSFPL
jgi:opacity protein-like surface antigen